MIAPPRARVRAAAARIARAAAPAWALTRPVVGAISALGWTVLGAAGIAWIIGWQLGWVEFLLVAAAALVLFAACALMTIGRTRLRVDLEVDPLRVVVGTPTAGGVRVTNTARGVLLPIVLELPIGTDAARFTLPTLKGGGSQEELFVVPTQRRGVVPIGPARTVRGDPFGLLRRTYTWTAGLELFVHPVTVPLEPLGAGLLRDLEGQTTNDMSMSDLAFHALRDYAPGDDRRYIHWRSSAKAGRFLVRQFLDTRRSHFATIVDSAIDSYADEGEYETAISVAASLAVRAIVDDQDLTVVAGAHAVPSANGRRALDTFSRAELGPHGLDDLSARAARISPDISVAVLITGSRLGFAELRRAGTHFPPEVRLLALRVDASRPTGLQTLGGFGVLSLQSLSALGPLLAGALT